MSDAEDDPPPVSNTIEIGYNPELLLPNTSDEEADENENLLVSISSNDTFGQVIRRSQSRTSGILEISDSDDDDMSQGTADRSGVADESNTADKSDTADRSGTANESGTDKEGGTVHERSTADTTDTSATVGNDTAGAANNSSVNPVTDSTTESSTSGPSEPKSLI